MEHGLSTEELSDRLRVFLWQRPEGPGVASAAPLWRGSFGGRRAGVEGRRG